MGLMSSKKYSSLLEFFMHPLSDSGEIEKRIRAWYQKGIIEQNPFDAYIYLWIAFNGYYYAYRIDKNSNFKEAYQRFLGKKSDSENMQIKFVAQEFSVQFQETIIKENLIDDFFNFQKKRRKQE